MKAYFTSDTDFFVRESREDMKFILDPAGKVTGFSAGGTLVRKVN